MLNANSLSNILLAYTAGDEARNLQRAADPTGRTLAVTEGLSFRKALTKDTDNNIKVGNAFAVGSDSKLSVETREVAHRHNAGRYSNKATHRHSPSTFYSPSCSPSPQDRGGQVTVEVVRGRAVAEDTTVTMAGAVTTGTIKMTITTST